MKGASGAAALEERETSIEESGLLASGWEVENVFRRLVRKARGVGREVGGCGMGRVWRLAARVGEARKGRRLDLCSLSSILSSPLLVLHVK